MNKLDFSQATTAQLIRSGELCEEEGDYTTAKYYYEKAVAANASESYIVKLSRAYIRLNEKFLAEKLLTRALERYPTSTRLLSLYVTLDTSTYSSEGVAEELQQTRDSDELRPARHARLALAFAFALEPEAALFHARKALFTAPSAEATDVLRLTIAQRFAILGLRSEADRVARMKRDTGFKDALLLDQLLIRTRTGGSIAECERLLTKIDPKTSEHAIATREMFDYRWRVHGATKQYLQEARRLLTTDRHQNDDDFHLAWLSMATQLGDLDEAAVWLARHPHLAMSAGRALAIGRLLPLSGIELPRELAAKALASAHLLSMLDESSKTLHRFFGAPSRSIAVIGNSPCELGRGRGPEIDAHDEVVRFNRFQITPPFSRDYGTRQTAWVRIGVDRADFKAPPGPKLIFLASSSIAYRGRGWRMARRMMAEGHTLTAFPPGQYVELAARLKALPSSGLGFAYALSKVRPSLESVNFYGFSFTDQIGTLPTSAHYFEKARPSMLHNWEKEAAFFAEMLRTRVNPHGIRPPL